MKTIYAPPPSSSTIFKSIYSIKIYENETVEWQWLYLPDGNRVVVDYKVFCLPKTDSKNS